MAREEKLGLASLYLWRKTGWRKLTCERPNLTVASGGMLSSGPGEGSGGSSESDPELAGVQDFTGRKDCDYSQFGLAFVSQTNG